MNTSVVELKMYNDLMRFQIILFLFLAHHNPLSALALIYIYIFFVFYAWFAYLQNGRLVFVDLVSGQEVLSFRLCSESIADVHVLFNDSMTLVYALVCEIKLEYVDWYLN